MNDNEKWIGRQLVEIALITNSFTYANIRVANLCLNPQATKEELDNERHKWAYPLGFFEKWPPSPSLARAIKNYKARVDALTETLAYRGWLESHSYNWLRDRAINKIKGVPDDNSEDEHRKRVGLAPVNEYTSLGDLPT